MQENNKEIIINENNDNQNVIDVGTLVQDKQLYDKILIASRGGTNRLAQNIVIQSMQIEADWIDSIENGLFSIEQIVKKPKTFIKEERELLSVERARRVDALAVRHLSTHTEYIKEIRPDGTIRPSKVMSRMLEQDTAIYENRFVYALVKRMIIFVERRYTAIKDKSQIKDNTVLSSTSKFRFGKADVDYKMLISIKTPHKNQELLDTNKELLERLEFIRQRLMLIEGTEFAATMRKHKAVTAPIMKTNILTGNVDYRNCYNLWIMLSRYTSVGYYVDIQRKSLPFDDEYFDDLSTLTAMGVSKMAINNQVRDSIYQGISFDRKVRRRFRVNRRVDFTVDKLTGNIGNLDNDISQYYFDRIKSLSSDITSLSTAHDTDTFDDVRINFRRYYKGLQKINNELYYDVLKMNEKISESVAKRSMTSYREAVADQKRMLRKCRLLTQLSKEELRLATLRQQTQERKLARMEKNLVRLEKRTMRMRQKKLKQQQKAAKK